jgi:hypothetical protein
MAGVTFKPSDRPLPERLGLSPGSRLLVLGTPLPGMDDWDVVRVGDDADVVIAVCMSVEDVLGLVPRAWAARKPGGRLWVAYRKGRRDLTRTEIGEAVEGLALGLTWFRQTSVDEVWSAIWLKHRTEFRTLNR